MIILLQLTVWRIDRAAEGKVLVNGSRDVMMNLLEQKQFTVFFMVRSMMDGLSCIVDLFGPALAGPNAGHIHWRARRGLIPCNPAGLSHLDSQRILN